MTLIKRGPDWSLPTVDGTAPFRRQHVEYVQSLLESGRAVIAGPIKDDPELAGVYIFRAKSAEEANLIGMGTMFGLEGSLAFALDIVASNDRRARQTVKGARQCFSFTFLGYWR